MISFKYKKHKNITKYRYYVWFITTPTMLLTLMNYYDEKSITIKDFLINNKENIILVVILNFLMLFFGLWGELKIINYNLGGVLSFISFVIIFEIIRKNYVKDKNQNIFYYFVSFWTLYGITYFQSYDLKNSIYNILDLFAKNGFGIILVWIIYNNK